MERLSPGLTLAGRVLMSIIFLSSAVGKLANWGSTAAMMAGAGMPLVPLLLACAIALELLGGLALLLGLWTGLGAFGLAVFLVPATLVFHQFWAAAPADAQLQTVNFLKNVAILGGLLGLVSHGPGALSLDAYLAGRRATSGRRR